jgi:hypothetical protein
LDHFTARQLAGERDVGKLLSAAEALERLLPRGVSAFNAEAHKARLDDVRRKFHQLIERHAEHIEHERDRKIAALEAAVAEKDQVIAEKNAVIATLTAGAAPSPPAPSPPTPTASPAPAQTSSQPPLGPPNTPIPRHYLRDGQPPSLLVGDVRYDRWSNRN